MVILPGTCPNNVRWECCSFNMLTQGFPCRRNVIYVSSFEREEFLSRVISDLKIMKPFLPTGTGKRTRLPRRFIKGMHYFPDVIMA